MIFLTSFAIWLKPSHLVRETEKLPLARSFPSVELSCGKASTSYFFFYLMVKYKKSVYLELDSWTQFR